MISLIYVATSVVVLLIQFKLAAIVPKQYGYVYIYILFCALSGTLHYRIFSKGSIWGFDLSSSIVDVFSAIALLLTVFVAIGWLSKRFR